MTLEAKRSEDYSSLQKEGLSLLVYNQQGRNQLWLLRTESGDSSEHTFQTLLCAVGSRKGQGPLRLGWTSSE
jgi:hypothetical protein